MTFLDQLSQALLGAYLPPPPLGGRIVDTTGMPLERMTVRARDPNGWLIAETTTGEDGRFTLRDAMRGLLRLEISASPAAGARPDRVLRFDGLPPSTDLGDLMLWIPVRLSDAVGENAANRPADVRRVQDVLHRYGRLTDADVAAEPVDLAAAPPFAPGRRTMTALALHLESLFGRRLPATRVDPADATGAALGRAPPFGIASIALTRAVGQLAGGDGTPINVPAEFQVVQSRLQQFGLLTRAAQVAEQVGAGGPPAVDTATRPATCEAIRRLDRQTAGGSLRAIVPAEANHRGLNDPLLAGRQPLDLRGSVGAGAANAPADVRAVQDRLLDLGYLSPASYGDERPALPAASAGPTRVADAMLVGTIAALRRLRTNGLGEVGDAEAVPGRLDLVDVSLLKLEWPRSIDLGEPVGWNVPLMPGVNRPRDIRPLQDRLHALGFLSDVDHAAELVDPHDTAPIVDLTLLNTFQAMIAIAPWRGALGLEASVGAGAVNRRADVRAVQDRLHGVHRLADADYLRERVDPALPGPLDPVSLAATFAAITSLRLSLFRQPAPVADAPWTALPIVQPGDEVHALLVDPLLSGRRPLNLGAPVGERCPNAPRDVRAVQDRLLAMRLMTAADHVAEAVDAAGRAPVADAALAHTIVAIRRLRTALMNEVEPVRARVDLRSEALVVLDDRFGRSSVELVLADRVGTGAANLPADVRALQRRLLDLGFLSRADHELEADVEVPTGALGVPDAELGQTFAALRQWRRLMQAESPADADAGPFSELVRTLASPRKPRVAAVEISRDVGRGLPNRVTDVRTVQDRLFELGLMDAADYFRDRLPMYAGGSAADSVIGTTIAAIELAERTIAGLGFSAPAGQVPVGGRIHRVLQDPSHASSTHGNPCCTLSSAGPARPTFASAVLNRLCLALELREGGRSSGEIPAVLRNGSGTPTSWGIAQVIGSTAIGTLVAHPAFASHYGLDGPTCVALQTRANSAIARFNAIHALVAAATSEAALQTQVAAYVATNAVAVRQGSGLGPRDIEAMFRTHQLFRHLQGLTSDAAARALFDAHAHPDAAANLAWLRLNPGEAVTYRNHPDFIGEHRQGFATRALLASPHGQTLRNAFTDDTGFKLGRYVVSDNWNSTDGLGLTTAQRVSVTAYMHNHGGGAATHAANIDAVQADAYVVSVNAIYATLP